MTYVDTTYKSDMSAASTFVVQMILNTSGPMQAQFMLMAGDRGATQCKYDTDPQIL